MRSDYFVASLVLAFVLAVGGFNSLQSVPTAERVELTAEDGTVYIAPFQGEGVMKVNGFVSGYGHGGDTRWYDLTETPSAFAIVYSGEKKLDCKVVQNSGGGYDIQCPTP